MLCALDDWGRASANPRTLKAQVVPAFASITADHVACWVKLYEKHGLVTVYGTVDRQVLCVDQEAWYRYQTQIPRDRREKQASRFPAPPDCASSSETALVLSRTSEQVLPPSSSPFPSPLVPPPTPPPIIPPSFPPTSPPLSRRRHKKSTRKTTLSQSHLPRCRGIRTSRIWRSLPKSWARSQPGQRPEIARWLPTNCGRPDTLLTSVGRLWSTGRTDGRQYTALSGVSCET